MKIPSINPSNMTFNSPTKSLNKLPDKNDFACQLKAIHQKLYQSIQATDYVQLFSKFAGHRLTNVDFRRSYSPFLSQLLRFCTAKYMGGRRRRRGPGGRTR
ncbi:hypothetical protein, partial [uncultured Corynebacterium sp.]|uniref:hypothetical protein n=1 Tax=uncultured Corynebacterium sp. TaxID=159447 RepID=UPI00288BCACE